MSLPNQCAADVAKILADALRNIAGQSANRDCVRVSQEDIDDGRIALKAYDAMTDVEHHPARSQVRAVYEDCDNIESMPIDVTSSADTAQVIEHFGREPDAYGVYLNMDDGTQQHVADFSTGSSALMASMAINSGLLLEDGDYPMRECLIGNETLHPSMKESVQ